MSQLVGQFDSLKVLVNCAGLLQRGGAEFEEATFLAVLDANLSGTMRLCVACRPLLAKSHGCIVNTASMLSFFGSGFVPAYSASKGGVSQLTKSLAIAWAGEGIRVNAVAPGWIETPMTQPLVDDAVQSADLGSHANASLGSSGGNRGAGVVSVLTSRGVHDRSRDASRWRILDCLSVTVWPLGANRTHECWPGLRRVRSPMRTLSRVKSDSAPAISPRAKRAAARWDKSKAAVLPSSMARSNDVHALENWPRRN